jgi:hypothetical protein
VHFALLNTAFAVGRAATAVAFKLNHLRRASHKSH